MTQAELDFLTQMKNAALKYQHNASANQTNLESIAVSLESISASLKVIADKLSK